MKLHVMDQFGLYLLLVLTIVIVLLTISTIARYQGKHLIIKDGYILLTSLVLTLLSALHFDIDWDFQGELKDARITKDIFLFMFSLTNLLTAFFIGLTILLRRLKKPTPNNV